MDKVLSNEKLVKFLDYNPKMNYKEEVDKITDWYREVRKITYANLAWTKTQYESQRN
jgi:hypothetical protein